jgi:hypothetical protein
MTISIVSWNEWPIKSESLTLEIGLRTLKIPKINPGKTRHLIMSLFKEAPRERIYRKRNQSLKAKRNTSPKIPSRIAKSTKPIHTRTADKDRPRAITATSEKWNPQTAFLDLQEESTIVTKEKSQKITMDNRSHPNSTHKTGWIWSKMTNPKLKKSLRKKMIKGDRTTGKRMKISLKKRVKTIKDKET